MFIDLYDEVLLPRELLLELDELRELLLPPPEERSSRVMSYW